MKVCFIVGTLGRGGAEKQLYLMLRTLRSREIDVRVLCLTKGEDWENEIRSIGVPIEWIGRHGSRVLRLIAIVNNLRKTRADIVQSSHFYTNIYAGIAGRILGIRSIGAVRNDLWSELAAHGYLGKLQMALPDFLIVNSELAHQRTIDKGVSAQRVALLSNVVEIESEIRPEGNNGVINLLFVGRLHEDKNPSRFIRLASIITKMMPELSVRFRIVGGGPLESRLVMLAKELNVPENRLEFTGIRFDMAEIYRSSDVLISTSVREGTANVILEAMAYGLPVVATKVGGTPQIVNAESGILVEPDDNGQLEKAVERLLKSESLRRQMGACGREYVKKHHSVEMLSHELPKIYEELLK